MKKRYDLKYEGGKCPIGYEYVAGFKRNGHEVRAFCRKISKYRFSDPLSRDEKARERAERESHNRIVRMVNTSGDEYEMYNMEEEEL